MRYRVDVLPRADADADRIFIWLKERSPQGAVAWYEAYTDALDSLTENPDIWSFADEGDLRGRRIHQLIFRTANGRPYRLLFSILSQHVEVMHVQGPGQSTPAD
jgi:plasmid stabilization system protein ParE